MTDRLPERFQLGYQLGLELAHQQLRRQEVEVHRREVRIEDGREVYVEEHIIYIEEERYGWS